MFCACKFVERQFEAGASPQMPYLLERYAACCCDVGSTRPLAWFSKSRLPDTTASATIYGTSVQVLNLFVGGNLLAVVALTERGSWRAGTLNHAGQTPHFFALGHRGGAS